MKLKADVFPYPVLSKETDDFSSGLFSMEVEEKERNDSFVKLLCTYTIENDDIDLGHEAKIGRIADESIYYLMSRGFSEEEAKAMVVRGFAEPISKELPLEYAVEMNRLITLEFEGAIG